MFDFGTVGSQNRRGFDSQEDGSAPSSFVILPNLSMYLCVLLGRAEMEMSNSIQSLIGLKDGLKVIIMREHGPR